MGSNPLINSDLYYLGGQVRCDDEF